MPKDNKKAYSKGSKVKPKPTVKPSPKTTKKKSK